jgi:hypothetical protein
MYVTPTPSTEHRALSHASHTKFKADWDHSALKVKEKERSKERSKERKRDPHGAPVCGHMHAGTSGYSG